MMFGGKLYFFTATNLQWKWILREDRHKLIVLNSLRFLVSDGGLKLYAFVIMPNHIHLVWSFPEFSDPAKVQLRFMKFTAQSLLEDFKRNQNPLLKELRVDAADREYQVWKRNPLAIELFTESVMWQKLEYIHNNPCISKWKLAITPEEYRFSSASFYILNKSEWNFLTSILET
jgi:putative transposase